jgi:predicted RNA binding protein YcfA (HicA-like mRNA interferase family)
MSSDPAVSGKDAIRALRKLGFRLDRVEGSHHMLIKDGHPSSIPVPVYGVSRCRPVLWRVSFALLALAGERSSLR